MAAAPAGPGSTRRSHFQVHIELSLQMPYSFTHSLKELNKISQRVEYPDDNWPDYKIVIQIRVKFLTQSGFFQTPASCMNLETQTSFSVWLEEYGAVFSGLVLATSLMLEAATLAAADCVNDSYFIASKAVALISTVHVIVE
ncbi:hypothetical protein TURU_004400 [Turdus rufiventris]|nr:hypothetical protein TURU_004400 [Turdus rufiventris]